MKSFQEVEDNFEDRRQLDAVISNLDTLQGRLESAKDQVVALRSQVDQVENQNSKMVNKDRACKEILRAAENLMHFKKITSAQEMELARCTYRNTKDIPIAVDILNGI